MATSNALAREFTTPLRDYWVKETGFPVYVLQHGPKPYQQPKAHMQVRRLDDTGKFLVTGARVLAKACFGPRTAPPPPVHARVPLEFRRLQDAKLAAEVLLMAYGKTFEHVEDWALRQILKVTDEAPDALDLKHAYRITGAAALRDADDPEVPAEVADRRLDLGNAASSWLQTDNVSNRVVAHALLRLFWSV